MEHTIIDYDEDGDFVAITVTVNDEGKYEDADGNTYDPLDYKPFEADFEYDDWAEDTAHRIDS